MKRIYLAIDQYAEIEVVLAILLPTLLSLFSRVNTSVLFSQLSFAVFVSYFATQIIKRIVKKPRKKNTKRTNGSYAFPSSHSGVAFAFAIVSSFYFPALSIVLFSIAFFVSYSRIQLGVHDWTDVTAGGIIGMAIAIISLVYL